MIFVPFFVFLNSPGHQYSAIGTLDLVAGNPALMRLLPSTLRTDAETIGACRCRAAHPPPAGPALSAATATTTHAASSFAVHKQIPFLLIVRLISPPATAPRHGEGIAWQGPGEPGPNHPGKIPGDKRDDPNAPARQGYFHRAGDGPAHQFFHAELLEVHGFFHRQRPG